MVRLCSWLWSCKDYYYYYLTGLVAWDRGSLSYCKHTHTHILCSHTNVSLPSQIHTIFLSPGMHCRHQSYHHPIIKNIERYCNTHTFILQKGNIKLSHFFSHSLSVTLFQKHSLIPCLTSLINYCSLCLAHILPLYFSERRLIEFPSVLKLARTRLETC